MKVRSEEHERIEKPKAWISIIKRFHIVGATLAIAFLFLGVSLGIIITAQTTPSGFPTVIEPGSQVSGASYVVFLDNGNYYAKNGTTGAIDYSSTNALTFLNQVIDLAPRSGIIALGPGDYSWSGTDYLLIDKPGLTFIGSASETVSGNTGAHKTTPTNLTGDVTIIAEGVRMESLNIGGTLNITTDDPVTTAPHWLRFVDVCIFNGLRFSGISGATDWFVPFSIIFEGGAINRLTSGPIIDFDNLGAPINHVYFYGTTIYQNNPGDVISMSGRLNDIYWTNCVFLMYEPGQTLLNFTKPVSGAYHYMSIGFTDCMIELGAANTVIVYAASDLYSYPLNVAFKGGWIQPVAGASDDPTMVVSSLSSGLYDKWVLFDGVRLDDITTLKFNTNTDGGGTSPLVLPIFTNCVFQSDGVAIDNTGGAQSSARFFDNYHLNPVGTITNAFCWSVISITNIVSDGHTWVSNNTNYTVRDVDCLITSANDGGCYDITVWDGNGNVVLTGVTTLVRELIPWGYTVKWLCTGYPTITVEGL